ncbi:Tetraspanin family protein [Tritrichomonas foetus]|uniref:Tetraspanin family protein n=1 Tax=Tritrichomonas foetus TaxID=1144522 RepID=A0A1J4JLR7_9EUKA|nr:Tetraspanin family protein [Tritrichomonas foetus]|eukprot:OHS99351.1 Tetraspanin family protein [Tritrichomonas foetus]
MCCKACARWIIGIVNLAVIICAVVAGVVIYKKESGRDWIALLDNNLPFIILLVAAGFAVFSALIGFFLCCCKKKCLNVTYLILIFIVIIVEVVAVVLAFLYQDKLIDAIGKNWYFDELKVQDARKKLEEALECCGFTEYNATHGCGYPEQNLSTPTCFLKIEQEVKQNMKDLKIGVIAMAAIEVILLFCAIYLVCCNKKSDNEGIAKF